MRPRITLVVAVADNGVIGRAGALPWHLPEDLRRFKQLTLGKPIVMGRLTYESIGRPLPGRRNIVISRGGWSPPPDVVLARSLEDAIVAAADAEEIMVIGGAELYREALSSADRIHLTRVHARPEGEVRFPPLRHEDWQVSARSTRAADERHAHAMTFETLERVAPAGASERGTP